MTRPTADNILQLLRRALQDRSGSIAMPNGTTYHRINCSDHIEVVQLPLATTLLPAGARVNLFDTSGLTPWWSPKPPLQLGLLGHDRPGFETFTSACFKPEKGFMGYENPHDFHWVITDVWCSDPRASVELASSYYHRATCGGVWCASEGVMLEQPLVIPAHFGLFGAVTLGEHAGEVSPPPVCVALRGFFGKSS